MITEIILKHDLKERLNTAYYFDYIAYFNLMFGKCHSHRDQSGGVISFVDIRKNYITDNLINLRCIVS